MCSPEPRRRRRRLLLGALALLGLAAGALPAAAQGIDGPSFERRTIDGHRVALVIGNTAYKPATGWSPLVNAARDAAEIARVLGDPAHGTARFDVTLVPDGTREQITAAIRSFAEKAATADVAVIYYSGHGFEYNKTNFIVPVDAPGPVPAHLLRLYYVDIEEELVKLAQARGLNLVFLDACRNKVPIVLSDEASKGAEEAATFGAIQAPSSIVFYATSRGAKAYEEAPPGSKLSPFAQALAAGMSRPGLEFSAIIPGVTDYVSRVTGGSQRPLVQGSWTSAFYFVPAAAAPTQAGGGFGATGGASGTMMSNEAPPLAIDTHTLDTVDEPLLVAHVLEGHTPAELAALAEDGDPLAMYLLGYMYRYGVSLPADDAQARAWLARAAATGHPAGQLEYGHLLLHAPKAPADRAKALDLYEKAAAQGYAKAKTHLAEGLLSARFGAGPVSAEDRARALRLYREAAAQGHAGALYSLAFIDDRAKSVAGLRALAAAGNADGDHWLCDLAVRDHDAAQAAAHCGVAAKGGYVDSQAQLALLYAAGEGVPKSATDARYWARIALAQLDLQGDLRRQIAPLAN